MTSKKHLSSQHAAAFAADTLRVCHPRDASSTTPCATAAPSSARAVGRATCRGRGGGWSWWLGRGGDGVLVSLVEGWSFAEHLFMSLGISHSGFDTNC